MATKRTGGRKRSGKGRRLTKKELKKLLAKAQAQVADLLEDVRDGNVTQVELNAGLTEVEQYLDAMEPFDDEPR